MSHIEYLFHLKCNHLLRRVKDLKMMLNCKIQSECIHKLHKIIQAITKHNRWSMLVMIVEYQAAVFKQLIKLFLKGWDILQSKRITFNINRLTSKEAIFIPSIQADKVVLFNPIILLKECPSTLGFPQLQGQTNSDLYCSLTYKLEDLTIQSWRQLSKWFLVKPLALLLLLSSSSNPP